MKNSIYILSIFLFGFGVLSCKKTGSNSGVNVAAAIPTVTTNDATNINGTSATVAGNITNDGGSIVMESGICYSTSPGADTSKNKTTKYVISGNYSVTLNNLSLLTKYYYRAY